MSIIARVGRPPIRALARNVRLYPAFAAATSVLPWLPVFFLYFTERVGFDTALTLGAVYYVAVVVLEVPSGRLSDSVGRRPTLIVACASLTLAYAGFFVADSVSALVLCQVLLAGGIAFQSGSDSALLYDSLVGAGREHEYEAAEARARTVSMLALSASALAGGWLGSRALEWPYALAAVAALLALCIALNFVEPSGAVDEKDGDADADADADSVGAPRAQAGNGGTEERPAATLVNVLIDGLADPVLRWLLAWHVLAFTLAHVPYEFQQPWIRLLGEAGGIGGWFAEGDRAPMVSGIVIALSMAGGAVGAACSVALSRRLGLSRLLLLANLVQLAIVAGLALALHPALLVLLFARSFAMAMTHGPTLAAIAPRVPSARRATWLSVQSLVSRLGFSVVLFALARAVDAELDWPTLSRVLLGCALAGALLLFALRCCEPRALHAGEHDRPDAVKR